MMSVEDEADIRKPIEKATEVGRTEGLALRWLGL